MSKKYEIHRRGCEHVAIETLYANVGVFMHTKHQQELKVLALQHFLKALFL